MDTSEIVVVIIRDKDDRFFVHQRANHKKTFPNLYGLGIGGHIKQGERHKEAAKRELKEEAGLETTMKFLFPIRYQPPSGSPYNIYVYETFAQENIAVLIKEWQWSGWMNKNEVDGLQAGRKLCPDTAIFYQKYKLQSPCKILG